LHCCSFVKVLLSLISDSLITISQLFPIVNNFFEFFQKKFLYLFERFFAVF